MRQETVLEEFWLLFSVFRDICLFFNLLILQLRVTKYWRLLKNRCTVAICASLQLAGRRLYVPCSHVPRSVSFPLPPATRVQRRRTSRRWWSRPTRRRRSSWRFFYVRLGGRRSGTSSAVDTARRGESVITPWGGGQPEGVSRSSPLRRGAAIRGESVIAPGAGHGQKGWVGHRPWRINQSF